MGVYFNKRRTFRQYLSLIKYFSMQFLRSIPYRLTARKRMLPNFLIVGVMKGGTSSLYHYLNQHPDVKMSRVQEVHFFAKYYSRGLNYYRSFFPKKSEGKLSGESSPYYFFHPAVPARVKKDLPNCKIIVLLRDPVDRAYSHYQMHKGIDPADNFLQALAWEESRVQTTHERFLNGESFLDTSHQAYSYLKRGMYAEQLHHWLHHYSLDALLILRSEDFYADPKKTLKQVYAYLELPEIFPENLAPVNVRAYETLPRNVYKEIATQFEEDGRELRQLLGDQFTWNRYD